VEISVRAFVVQVQAGAEWEEEVIEKVNRMVMEGIKEALTAEDDRLLESRGEGLEVVGRRKRTLVTRWGPLVVRRRLYRSGTAPRFLLDEAMGWGRRRAMTPYVERLAVTTASRLPYRQAAEVLRREVPGGIGVSTLHRAVQAVGAAIEAKEQAEAVAVFEDGEVPPAGAQVVKRLFLEADGVNIALQRSPARRTELKVALGYSDSRSIAVDRHGRVRRELIGKVRYAGLDSVEQFWPRAWLVVGRSYDLSQVRQLVCGGDGAAWIRGAEEGIGHSVFQLDSFHLSRALRTGLVTGAGAAYRAARNGDHQALHSLLESGRPRADEPERLERWQELNHYLANNADGLMSWRHRLGDTEPEQPRLGAMEANIDKPFANRFKKRVMSWSPSGAQHMAKVIQTLMNGKTLPSPRDRSSPPLAPLRARNPLSPAPSASQQTGPETQPALQAALGPRHGPHSAKPWVRVLRSLTDPPIIAN
jgi:hypothetical protein